MGGNTKRKSLAAYDDSDSDEQPISKKAAKPKSKKKSTDGIDDEHSSSKPPKKTIKKPRVSAPDPETSGGDEDADAGPALMIKTTMEGEKYLELGKKKRATVRAFKGATLIDIREFYGEDGDEKPGKKGISLSVDQWKTLMEARPAIDRLITRMK
ncbi:transcriptional Coactivator p15-domain-containing protein [Amylostereum chailletii]|nr:transcriptional Coactivator p15-domain-containing protein [Amylostereum chailletii]